MHYRSPVREFFQQVFVLIVLIVLALVLMDAVGMIDMEKIVAEKFGQLNDTSYDIRPVPILVTTVIPQQQTILPTEMPREEMPTATYEPQSYSPTKVAPQPTSVPQNSSGISNTATPRPTRAAGQERQAVKP